MTGAKQIPEMPLGKRLIAQTADDRRIDVFRMKLDVFRAPHLNSIHRVLYTLKEGTEPTEARQAKAEADFQTRRALKLAPENEEVQQLRAEVIKLLQLPV
jgi:hypothetical protein